MRLAFGAIFVVGFVFAACEPVIVNQSTTASSSSASSSSSSTGSGMGGTGGSNGTGGSAGTGGAVMSPLPECVYDSDCMLINDCCRCEGVPANSPVPDCPSPECFAPTCESLSIPQPMAVCRAGQCVVNADCDQNHALCDSLPPQCPPGKTVIVGNGCWGGCLDVTECQDVGSCTQCADGQACVSTNTMMMGGHHCVDAPNSCNGQVSCACMGESVCGFAKQCVEQSPTELYCVDITTK